MEERFVVSYLVIAAMCSGSLGLVIVIYLSLISSKKPLKKILDKFRNFQETTIWNIESSFQGIQITSFERAAFHAFAKSPRLAAEKFFKITVLDFRKACSLALSSGGDFEAYVAMCAVALHDWLIRIKNKPKLSEGMDVTPEKLVEDFTICIDGGLISREKIKGYLVTFDEIYSMPNGPLDLGYSQLFLLGDALCMGMFPFSQQAKRLDLPMSRLLSMQAMEVSLMLSAMIDGWLAGERIVHSAPGAADSRVGA